MFKFIQDVVFVIYFSVLARVTYIMLSTHCPPCFLSNVTVVIMAILFNFTQTLQRMSKH